MPRFVLLIWQGDYNRIEVPTEGMINILNYTIIGISHGSAKERRQDNGIMQRHVCNGSNRLGRSSRLTSVPFKSEQFFNWLINYEKMWSCPCTRHENTSGSGGTDPLILNPGARRKWVVNITLRSLYPRASPATDLTGGWDGRRAGLDV